MNNLKKYKSKLLESTNDVVLITDNNIDNPTILYVNTAFENLHATQWLWTYNNERPNTAIGGIPTRQKLALVA